MRQRVLYPTPHPQAIHVHPPIPMPRAPHKPSECLKHKEGTNLGERHDGFGQKWDWASIITYPRVAYLDAFVKIPHAKVIGVQFFLLGVKLVLVPGQFEQKVGQF